MFGLLSLLLLLGCGWWFWLRQEKVPSFVNLTLGREEVAGVAESGFSSQEHDRLQQPFRWTEGRARLVIPIDSRKPPYGLFVRLQAWRPAGVKTVSLQLAVNKGELFNGNIPSREWENTFDLRNLDLGKEVVVDLVSDTFVPRGVMDGGTNEDARSLGVQVMGVKLLGRPDAGDERAGSARVWEGHPQGVCCGGVTRDGLTLVSGSWDGTVKVWDVAVQQERNSFPNLAPNLQALAVSPDGAIFATANHQMVRQWDSKTGQPRSARREHAGTITSLAYSPDGKTLASAGGNRYQPGELKVWDAATGVERVAIAPFPLRLWDVAYAPDGKSVAVAGGNREAAVVDLSTGKVAAAFPHPAYVRRVAFSPDGNLLATAYGDEGEMRIHDLNAGTERSAFQTPGGKPVFGLAYSRDGQRLLTPCADGEAFLWDVSNPPARLRAALKGHTEKVRFAVFFPDGQTAATGSDDRTIRLWDIVAAESSPESSATASPKAGWKLGWTVGAILALLIAASFSVGAWLYLGHVRRRKTDASSISV